MTTADPCPSTSPTRTMTCRTCGSDQVVRDAWACWSVEDQHWELGEVFDHAFCVACEDDCDLLVTESNIQPPSAESATTIHPDH
jgi:hypothetical protein